MRDERAAQKADPRERAGQRSPLGTMAALPSRGAVGILLVGATTAEGGTIDVRIDAGRIAAVGALERLPDDEVHDLTGYVLLPRRPSPMPTSTRR